MALLKLDFKPGVNKEDTPYTNEGGWVSSDKIRFRSGRPEKIGGWQKLSQTQLDGCVRAIHTVRTLDGTVYTFFGSTTKVYAENGGTFYDVTPVRETQALSGAIDTSAGSAVITINDTAHGADNGAYVTISGVAGTDGVDTVTEAGTSAGGVQTVTEAGTSTGTATFTAVAQTSTSGNGTGATFDVSASGGTYTVTAVAAAGSGYEIGDTITLDGANLGGVTTTNDLTLTITAIVSATFTAVAQTSTSGSGTGATFNITASGGTYTVTSVVAAGGSYAASDTITIAGTSLGGATPDNDLTLTVASVVEVIDNIPVSEINAEHQLTYVDADSYTITVTTLATAGVTGDGGASISAEYQVNPGFCSATPSYGFGAGAWNRARNGGGWNKPALTAGVSLNPREWNFANWGEDVVMNYPGGPVYIWDATSPLARGTQITQAPHKVNYLTVTNDRHLVCFGCNAPGTANASTDLDTLNIRWSDQEDYTTWTITATNTAGDKLLTNGTEILGVANVENQTLIWTDDSVESMQFVGPPYTFAFAKAGTGSGLVSSKAWAAYDNVVYWMGEGAFYVYQGGTNVLPCTMQKYVFDGLSVDHKVKTFAVLNRKNNEVSWFYPATSVSARHLNGAINATTTTIYLDTTAALPLSGSIDIDNETITYTGKTDYSLTGVTRGASGTTAATHADGADVTTTSGVWNDEPYHYITYNVIDKIWWEGKLERSAMIDSGVLDYPLAVGTDGYVYQHEIGYDADGGPMVAYIQSGDFDIGQGDSLMHIHRAIPDFFLDGSLDLTMQTKYYPQASEVKETVGTVTPTTQKINTRIRARNIALRIESDDVGDYWKYGSVKIDQRTDGRR